MRKPADVIHKEPWSEFLILTILRHECAEEVPFEPEGELLPGRHKKSAFQARA